METGWTKLSTELAGHYTFFHGKTIKIIHEKQDIFLHKGTILAIKRVGCVSGRRPSMLLV